MVNKTVLRNFFSQAFKSEPTRMDCLLTDDCCCCFSLKTGSNFLSSIQIILGLLTLVFEWYYDTNMVFTVAAAIFITVGALYYVAIIKVRSTL